MTDRPLKLLLVSHFFAPSVETGANRATALARHLRADGHELTVLTSSAYGSLSEDREVGNVRTWDLQLVATRLGGRTPPAGSADTFSMKVHPASRVLVPDAHLAAWIPFALARAVRLARERPYDCVLTSSPPESAHLIGRALRRRGIPWVADLRDGWAFEPWVKQALWPTRTQHRINEWLERRTLRAADGVTAVSPLVVDYLRNELGLVAEMIPNGWEPDSRPAAGDGAPGLDPERVSVVYTGRIAGGRKDPMPLIDAVRELARDDPETAARLELVFAGAFTEEERRLMSTSCSPAQIVDLGRLERDEVAALQRAADAGIDLTSHAGRQAVGSKLFEYIGAGLPIVLLAPPDSASARIVAEARGLVVDPDDEAAIKSALRSLVRGEVEAPDDDTRSAYSWEVLSEQLVGVVRAAIAAAATRPGRT